MQSITISTLLSRLNWFTCLPSCADQYLWEHVKGSQCLDLSGFMIDVEDHQLVFYLTVNRIRRNPVIPQQLMPEY